MDIYILGNAMHGGVEFWKFIPGCTLEILIGFGHKGLLEHLLKEGADLDRLRCWNRPRRYMQGARYWILSRSTKDKSLQD